MDQWPSASAIDVISVCTGQRTPDAANNWIDEQQPALVKSAHHRLVKWL